MNVKLRVLTAGVLFFTGQVVFAQNNDSLKNERTIEEVVVLGYNKTQTKPKDVTASVTVSAEKLENRPNVSFLNSLQGEAPGLSISSTSGSPGSAKIDVIIRGVSSLNASSDPLYVIDGMISNTVQFRNLNPNDIETVSVLKDAQATAIYGNRGSNGVIVIRTKQGKYGSRFNVSYNGTMGLSFLPNTNYNMADSKQLLKLQQMYNDGMGAGMTDQQIANYDGPNTNWRNELFRTGTTQSHDVSLAFGGERVNNFTSVGYFDQTGTVPTTDFKRFTLRNNMNARSLNNRFTLNTNLALAYSRRNQLEQETVSALDVNIVQNPLLSAITGVPLLDPNKYATGTQMFNGFGTNFSNGEGVYSLLDILRGNVPNRLTETSAVANFAATYKITDELSVTNKSGIDFKYSTRNFARAPWSYLALAVAIPSGREYPGIESFQNTSEFNFNSITSLNYSKTFGKHTIDAGVYMDYLKSHFRATNQQQEGLNSLNWVFGAGTGYVAFNTATPAIYRPTISLSKLTVGTLAYFATVDYDFDGKYGVAGTIRRDATFRFSDENKWGTFWSVGGRWNIDKESFMEGSTFSMLKLRGSYGVIGNQNVIAATYGTNPLYTGTNLIRNTLVVGQGYNQINGALANSVLANPVVQWEEVGQANVGLDFRLLNNKLEGTVDYYKKTTRKLYNDIFYTNAAGQNPQTGSNTIKGNNGKLSNEGIELMLKYNIFNGQDFKLSIYGNGAYNKGKVLESNITTGINRNNPGSLIGEWFLVDYIGVNQANGNLLFDVNGNAVETYDVVNDLKGTGKSYLPKYVGGFGVNTSYKNFSLDAHFTYQADVWRMDNQLDWVYDATQVRGQNVSADLLNAWTPNNTNTNVPSIFMTNQIYGDNSTRFLKDASFIRLKNVVLGYSVPKEMLGDNIKGLKIFVQGENLLTFTKWRGYDPEPLFARSTSVYPNMKTATLGVNIDF
ncbi:SusC/RagA family TonB-linked outer membrane protein [Chryseobacterium taihuense]|uniref:TonB-linked outer membrane protein, SusC/RagA family n=1 Tax=Chryseobacterium taihuense TaxID=1141221 RepID=A0ABY0QQW2_9FLAO|nr:SusC/RagA family TonB-linked outer membrane protein [Chryseobacterium taihuense]SDL56386.1 TonB-linked outer membrane protein, SusC/RagA family [Chryseobacterium taihuense]